MMKDLFTLDMKDYNPDGPVTTRPSARAIINDGEKVLLVYSKKYNYYKFPGGGIESGEVHTTALIREVREETGYQILPDTISEYGRVLRLQKDTHNPDGIFQQENFYYFCRVESEPKNTDLDAYEADEGFTPVWIEPIIASRHNKYEDHAEDADLGMIRRDAKVLDMADLELRKRKRALRHDC